MLATLKDSYNVGRRLNPISLEVVEITQLRTAQVFSFPVLTRAELYAVFTQQWFDREVTRQLNEDNVWKVAFVTDSALWKAEHTRRVQNVLQFCKELAYFFFMEGLTQIKMVEPIPGQNLDNGTVPMNDVFARILKKFVGRKQEWCCSPLKKNGYFFSFLHKTVQEYFVALAVCQELGSLNTIVDKNSLSIPHSQLLVRKLEPSDARLLLSQRLIHADGSFSTVRFCADLVDKQVQHYVSFGPFLDRTTGCFTTGYPAKDVGRITKPVLSEWANVQPMARSLWDIVQASRLDCARDSRAGVTAVAAANAITILNAAGIIFVDCDLSYATLGPVSGNNESVMALSANNNLISYYAFLSGAIFCNANLEHACLAYANMECSDLTSTNLNAANLEHVQFGELPTINALSRCVALSHTNSQYIVSVNSITGVSLWQVDTGQVVREFVGHTLAVNSVAISSNDLYIITGSDDMTVKLWQLVTSEVVRTFVGHTCAVKSVAISQNNQYIVSCSDDMIIMLWNVDSGKLVRTLYGAYSGGYFPKLYRDGIKCVIFSPDSQFIASKSGLLIEIWETKTGKEIFKKKLQKEDKPLLDQPGEIYDVDSKGLLSHGWSKFEFMSRPGVFSYEYIAHGIQNDYFPTEEDVKVACEIDEEIIQSKLAKEAANGVLPPGWSTHRRFMYWHEAAGFVTAYFPTEKDVEEASHIVEITVISKLAEEAANSIPPPGWNKVPSKSRPGVFYYDHTASGDRLYRFPTPEDDKKEAKMMEKSRIAELESKGVLPIGWNKVPSKSRTGVFSYCHEASNYLLKRFPLPEDMEDATKTIYMSKKAEIKAGIFNRLCEYVGRKPSIIAFSPNSKLLASADFSVVTVWQMDISNTATNIVEHELFKLYGHTGGITGVVFSPNGQLIASCSGDSRLMRPEKVERVKMGLINAIVLRLWRADTGEILQTFRGHTGELNCIAFSADSKFLVSCSAGDGTVRMWSCIADTSERVRNYLGGHTEIVRDAVFSPDRRFIVTCSDDNSVKIWTSDTCELLLTIENDDLFNGTLHCVAFSPCNKFVVVISGGMMGSSAILFKSDSDEVVWATKNIFHVFVFGVSFSPDGKSIILASDTTLWLLKSDSGEQIWQSNNDDNFEDGLSICDGSDCVEFSPDGNFIIPFSDCGDIYGVYRSATGEELLDQDEKDEVQDAFWERFDAREFRLDRKENFFLVKYFPTVSKNSKKNNSRVIRMVGENNIFTAQECKFENALISSTNALFLKQKSNERPYGEK